MNLERCLITGCFMVDGSGASCYGDLFEVGNTYVFNAVDKPRHVNVDGQAKTLVLDPGVSHFCRRDVHVVPKVNAQLNYAAKEYLA